MTIQLLGISGSGRLGSFSSLMLDEIKALAEPELFNIAEIQDFPMYNDDVRDSRFPPSVERVSAQIVEANAVVIVTPEYNRSIPPVLKNAIDWISRSTLKPFYDKPVCIISSSPSALGGALANHHLRQVLVYVGAWVMPGPETIIPHVQHKVNADGKLIHGDTRHRLMQAIGGLVAFARKYQVGQEPEVSAPLLMDEPYSKAR